MTTVWNLTITAETNDNESFTLEKVWIGELDEKDVTRYNDFVKSINEFYDVGVGLIDTFIENHKDIINEFSSEDDDVEDLFDTLKSIGTEYSFFMIDTAILCEVKSMRDLTK